MCSGANVSRIMVFLVRSTFWWALASVTSWFSCRVLTSENVFSEYWDEGVADSNHLGAGCLQRRWA